MWRYSRLHISHLVTSLKFVISITARHLRQIWQPLCVGVIIPGIVCKKSILLPGDDPCIYQDGESLVMVPINHQTSGAVDHVLTYWDRDKMAAIFQTFFKCIFLLKMYDFRITFHRILLRRVQLTIFQHWLRLWLGAGQATSQYLSQRRLINWRIYVSLSINEPEYNGN